MNILNDRGIWFASDQHFGQKGILKWSPETREGADSDEMDELLIERHNRKVKPNHTVYLIGDLMFHHKVDRINAILRRLNGRKHLIRGNHCYFPEKAGVDMKVFESVEWYKRIHIDKTIICLFHHPILEWDRAHYGSYHLYGHVHGKHLPAIAKYRCMDVGIDSDQQAGRPEPKMTPFSWEEIHEILRHRENQIHHEGAT